ncbi:General control protein [Emydomyces testavorans]|uniref:General control protein n=1 Tax=Emydomyces testavorans TaxID=2070801 RepID=A0AAF0DCH0_9EURO|nr:General control protein [Emydomyces testavorans]
MASSTPILAASGYPESRTRASERLCALSRSLPPCSSRRESTAPDQLNPALGQNRQHLLYLSQQQQRLQAQYFGSPVAQDPRVTSLINRSQGVFNSSNRSNSIPGVTVSSPQRGHALSAPGNLSHSIRPPVPLFPGTESKQQYTQAQTQPHRRAMSTSNLPHGMRFNPKLGDSVSSNRQLDLGDLLDFSAGTLAENLEASNDGVLFGEDHFKIMDFTSVNEPSPAVTVSPKDLIMDSSAPPSTSFTDMSTPSFDSPGYFSHETSPLFATDSELGPGHEEWESLFPSESSLLPKFDEKVTVSPPKPVSALSSPMVRTSSSPGSSPRNGRSSTRPSAISGVKPRNRDKPLPPIVYDTSDPIAAKRARNTEAARKSRARKVEHQELLERRIAELEKALEECRHSEAYWKSLAEAKQ